GRLRSGSEPSDSRASRPADLSARASAGAPPDEEPARRTAAVPLPDARPGGDARPLQGRRRRAGVAPARLPGLVLHADVSPLPAPAVDAATASRRRLDGRAVLPARHRRARPARPPARARLEVSGEQPEEEARGDQRQRKRDNRSEAEARGRQ